MRKYSCKGKRVEKSVIMSARTKWMAPDKCYGILSMHSSVKYTKASLPAKKMLLFSSIIITIISSYAIVRIYTTLEITCIFLKLRGCQNCFE